MGIGGTANTISVMRVEICRRALRVLAAPPIPPVYDSEYTYENPRGIGGACQCPPKYERENTKEGPEGIADTANTPRV